MLGFASDHPKPYKHLMTVCLDFRVSSYARGPSHPSFQNHRDTIRRGLSFTSEASEYYGFMIISNTGTHIQSNWLSNKHVLEMGCNQF